METCENSCEYFAKYHDESDVIGGRMKWFDIDGKNWFLPRLWGEQGEGFRNFKSRPDDVFLITQPRSGTTVTQELIWLLMNNLDFDNAKKFQLADRAPELPISVFPDMWKDCHIIKASDKDSKILEAVPVDASKPSYEVYADLPSPRVFKSHLSLSVHKDIFDTGCKIVYVVRNPKDVLVSQARFAAEGPRPFIKCSLEEMIKLSLIGQATWGPYWPHVKEAWDRRHHPNLLFIYYEELRADLPAAIKKIAKFLGKNLTDEQLKELTDHLDIEAFRKNPMVNELPGCKDRIPTFIGKGRVEGWNEVMSPELSAEVDQWIEKNIKDTDIAFPYIKK